MREPARHIELPPPWHVFPFRVPLFEVDLGHAVYHGNYFHLFELAREAFLRDLGHPYLQFMEHELHLTIVDVSCTYRRPLHYDDLIEIHTAVLGWRKRSMALSQAIFRPGDSRNPVLCTKATINMVCVRFTGQPTTLPEPFTQLLKKHPLAPPSILLT